MKNAKLRAASDGVNGYFDRARERARRLGRGEN